MIIYTVAVEHRGGPNHDQVVVSPVCAYTSKDEAEKHIQSLQQDLYGDTYYFWEALEVKERFELDDRQGTIRPPDRIPEGPSPAVHARAE